MSNQPTNIFRGRRIRLEAGVNAALHYVTSSAVLRHDGHDWCVVEKGGVFHLMHVVLDERYEGVYAMEGGASPESGYLHQPPHPRMTPEDIQGARYSEWTGTHWLFAHCSPHEQVDFAIETETFCYDLFAKAIDRALNSAQTGANTRARALTDLAEQSANEVFRRITSATLGEFHRSPHKDHRRDLSLEAIKKIHAAWTSGGSRTADLPQVKATYDALVAKLGREHSIDWRHERAALEARAGKDPIDDHEWCYTLVPSKNAVIAGAGNVPDPLWEFDAFPKSKMITRGTQTYWDHAPTRPSDKWIAPFRRPYTPGTAPGVSMGSVAWQQMENYQ